MLCVPDTVFCSSSMRLRVRVQRQTSRVELAGDDPGLTELIGHIREALVSSHGFRSVPQPLRCGDACDVTPWTDVFSVCVSAQTHPSVCL